MRITEQQRKSMVEASTEIFGRNATIKLFGSRVDDSLRGGDIDLFIEINGVDPLKRKKARQLISRITAKLGYVLPIDVVCKDDDTVIERIHEEGMNGLIL